MSTVVHVEDSTPSAMFSSLLRLSSSRSNRVTSSELLSISMKQRSRNCSTKSSKSAVARQIVSSSCKHTVCITVCSRQPSRKNTCLQYLCQIMPVLWGRWAVHNGHQRRKRRDELKCDKALPDVIWVYSWQYRHEQWNDMSWSFLVSATLHHWPRHCNHALHRCCKFVWLRQYLQAGVHPGNISQGYKLGMKNEVLFCINSTWSCGQPFNYLRDNDCRPQCCQMLQCLIHFYKTHLGEHGLHCNRFDGLHKVSDVLLRKSVTIWYGCLPRQLLVSFSVIGQKWHHLKVTIFPEWETSQDWM